MSVGIDRLLRRASTWLCQSFGARPRRELIRPLWRKGLDQAAVDLRNAAALHALQLGWFRSSGSWDGASMLSSGARQGRRLMPPLDYPARSAAATSGA